MIRSSVYMGFYLYDINYSAHSFSSTIPEEESGTNSYEIRVLYKFQSYLRGDKYRKVVYLYNYIIIIHLPTKL